MATQFQTFDEMAAVLSVNVPHALVQDWWSRLEHVIRSICSRLGAPSRVTVACLIDRYLSQRPAISPELIRELHRMRIFRNRCAHGKAPVMTAQEADSYARRAWTIAWDLADGEDALVV